MAIDQQGVDLTWEDSRKLCQDLSTSEWQVDLATFDNAEQLEAFSTAWLVIGMLNEIHISKNKKKKTIDNIQLQVRYLSYIYLRLPKFFL